MDGKVYVVGGGSSWNLVPQPWVLVYNPADPGLGWAVENTCLGTGTYAGAYGTVTSNGVSRIYASGGLDASSTRLTFSQRAGFPFPIDVGVDQILSPSGLIGAGTYTPQARIKNYGLNAVGSFTVRFDINPGGYSDIQTVTSLNSGDSIDVSFADWTVSSGGFYTATCTTALATDQEPVNDVATAACGIYNYNEDFEAAGVYTPNPASGAWEWGSPVGGPGGTPNDTACWATDINGSYLASSDWRLNSVTFYAFQDNPVLAYWHWYENEGYYDGYNVKMSTDGGSSWSIIHALPGYGQPYDQVTYSGNAGIPSESAYSNLDRTWRLNYMTVPVSFGDSFLLRWHFGSDASVQYWGTAIDFVCGIGFDTAFPVNRDVAVTGIVEPTTGSQPDTMTLLWPVHATTYNYGEVAETFTVVFDITGPVSFSYTDTQTVNLNSNEGATVVFDSVHFNEVGTHNAVCYVSPSVPGDSNVGNDTIRTTFEVVAVGSTVWEAMAPVPQPPSGKRPKSGSCMAGLEATGLIYYLKASNRNDFYSYDPNANTWTPLETIPKGEKALGDGKRPKKGAAMAPYNATVYVLRGNNTLGFWKYVADTIFGDSILGWRKLTNFPLGAKRVKDGSGLVKVEKGGDDYLFASRGAKQSDFYLYDIAGDSWIKVTSPPVGASGKTKYKKGTCMAYDDEYVYLLQGYYGSFFKYKVEGDSWFELPWYNYRVYRNRDGKKKKPKDGAALVYHNDWIYMLKGGNTVEMWKIKVRDTVGDWVQMDPASVWDIPLGASNKKVKAGGCMIKWGSYFYAGKGKNTDEFYRHGLPVETATYVKSITTAQGVMGNKVVTNNFKLTIAPNPAINVAAVRYTLPVPGPVNIKLYNVTGALVKSHTVTNPTKDGVFFIDAKALPSGVYILRFNAGDIRVTRKMVLEK
ncbi:MAG: T9SS type A sorting domain-containing protein [candidate division WOR-3 bacterium]|nr:T9SS type A sorting domain-containing protein [candidate division WOR-3 bacterium]